mmetsp:Transcript_32469/g.72941  ORF Transcript_32469/g.72941 Transcript_32469/m.72941 type:complete len:258 (-) Transcript_32469:303-1076(-)
MDQSVYMLTLTDRKSAKFSCSLGVEGSASVGPYEDVRHLEAVKRDAFCSSLPQDDAPVEIILHKDRWQQQDERCAVKLPGGRNHAAVQVNGLVVYRLLLPCERMLVRCRVEANDLPTLVGVQHIHCAGPGEAAQAELKVSVVCDQSPVVELPSRCDVQPRELLACEFEPRQVHEPESIVEADPNLRARRVSTDFHSDVLRALLIEVRDGHRKLILPVLTVIDLKHLGPVGLDCIISSFQTDPTIDVTTEVIAANVDI